MFLVAAGATATAQCYHLCRSVGLVLSAAPSTIDSLRASVHQKYSKMASCQDVYTEIKAASGVYKYYSNGQWLESSSGKSVPVINPSTQEKDYAVQGE